MLKAIALFFALIIGGLILLHLSLQNGSLLRFLDQHPNPAIVPAVDYSLGEAYYLFQDLPEATTFFLRVPDQYPHSSYADDAYFDYLQCLDDEMTPRLEMADAYDQYLQRFPQGAHAALARQRAEAYRDSR